MVTEIEPLPQGLYGVVVTEGGGETRHRVHVDKAQLEAMGLRSEKEGEPVPAGEVVDLLRRSFEFLLAREPKEAILKEFDLRDIDRYFPEYREKMR